jgi:hypothetical protein
MGQHIKIDCQYNMSRNPLGVFRAFSWHTKRVTPHGRQGAWNDRTPAQKCPTIPTERLPLVGEVSANFFADRGCHVVSVTDPYGRILDFLDRRRSFSSKQFLSCTRTHEAEWTPVPDSLLLRKSGSAGKRTRTSGSVARNSDHKTTEAITEMSNTIQFHGTVI